MSFFNCQECGADTRGRMFCSSTCRTRYRRRDPEKRARENELQRIRREDPDVLDRKREYDRRWLLNLTPEQYEVRKERKRAYDARPEVRARKAEYNRQWRKRTGATSSTNKKPRWVGFSPATSAGELVNRAHPNSMLARKFGGRVPTKDELFDF